MSSFAPKSFTDFLNELKYSQNEYLPLANFLRPMPKALISWDSNFMLKRNLDDCTLSDSINEWDEVWMRTVWLLAR